MFAAWAFALRARRPIRVVGIAAIVSVATFYIFTVGLGVFLPAGILQGVL